MNAPLNETQATILDALPAHIALIDSDGVIIAVNEHWRRFADGNGVHPPEYFLGHNYISVCEKAAGVHCGEAVAVADGLRKLLAGGISGFEFEYPCHSPAEKRWFRLMVTPLLDGQRAGAVVMHINVTERKQAELRLERLNRLYQVLSGINEMIVRVKDPDDLLEEACRIAATLGQFRVAAVFNCEGSGAPPEVIFHAGPEAGCFTDILTMVPQEILSRGSVNLAAATGLHNVSNDFSNDPRMPRFREAAQRCGFYSVAAFPLRRQNSVFAVLALYAGEVGYFQADEIKLLAAIAEDLSYAADALQNEKHRLETEAALRASEQRFRQIAEHFHGVFWMQEPATHQVLYMSPTYEKIWGRTCESLYASPKNWLDSIHPEDREPVIQDFAIHPSGDFNQVYRILHTDGGLRWIHARTYPVRNEQGEIYRVVGTAEDITVRKLAEEKLREHATLLDKAQDAILVRDLDQRIHFWNLSAERLYGWTATEAIGRSAEELLYSSNSEALHTATATVLEKGEWLGELQQTTRSGKLITVEARWSLVRDDQERPKSILTISTDITGRKLLEQQFLRAQRMECIGTLAGGIAHDLNNVLAPIMMSIDILKISTTDPRSVEILEMIGTSARRGADMVSQVLAFARGVEGRRIRIEIEPLIQDLVKITEDTFPKDILIRAEIGAHLWPLDADPTQIHQVLINLCVNARDAMPGGGQIIIRASNAAIDAHYAAMQIEAQVGNHLCIEVEDTGSGMTRETIENIFDPFFTTKEIGAGTGLGLSTALAIVKGHGGFVRVYSDPGTGSRFRMYFPAADADARDSAHAPSPILPRGQGETILVVDDEASIRQITRQTLEAFGYSVLVAADGAEAVSTFVEFREHIAVVLTDMMMPITDGPSLIKILRRLDPGVRIIGASGIASNAQLARSLQAGVKHFLAKPYTAETLLVTIQAILNEDPAIANRNGT